MEKEGSLKSGLKQVGSVCFSVCFCGGGLTLKKAICSVLCAHLFFLPKTIKNVII